ncbi:MAG: GNAT family N-acetyltransferase [Planctomycetota bacterium]
MLADLRARYDDEERRRVLPPPGRRIDADARLTRVVGPTPHPLDHMVSHARVSAADADAVIAAEVARVRREARGMQWNVYDDDEPPDLAARLERAGFRLQAREAVLVRPSDDDAGAAGPPDGVVVRRLTRADELGDYFAVDEAVWGTGFSAWVRSWFLPALAGEADPVAIFVAYADGAPVGCGWVTLPPRRTFAHLFGGTVLPSHRGRGVHGAIVAARARAARDAGLPWLVTDANAASEPLLRRGGFVAIARRTEWVLDPPAAAAR